MATIFLLLSIAFSTFINLIFRWFKDFKVNKFQAIIVNYVVCFIIGFSLSTHQDILSYVHEQWFIYCILLGFLFIAIFFSMALTTEKLGISVTAVSGKMSVVIPILFAYFFAKEDITLLFVIGLILSILSIYFITVKKELHIDKRYLMLPVIVFLGGGMIDTSLKVLQQAYSQDIPLSTISYSIFLGAFIAGTSIYLVKEKANFSSWEWKSVKAGVALGVPNYFSIFFLLSAIEGFSVKSAFVFGVNNVGIVLVSTLLSVLIFKEKLEPKNQWGLLLAVVSIAIISYAS
ncbi:MAG: drug/metabolite transporter (DMT)-like permease [Pseudoalteromonas distincta]|jgi:drug/metabolite transporter (DMT)-like permease